jgi:guanine deaminase
MRESLILGLSDTLMYAAQCRSAGLGYDVQLLDWLKNYTSPLEKKYSDVSFVT